MVILSRPRERPRGFLPINTADPLYVGLSTAVNYSQGGGGDAQIFEHVSRQFATNTSDWTWVPMLDPHNPEWGGGYVPSTTLTTHGCSLVANRLSLWRDGFANPPASYSFCYMFKPNDALANGVRRIGDTFSYAGGVCYVNYEAGVGATGGYISTISKTAAGGTLNEFFRFPANPLPWVMVCKSVDPVNGSLVYANLGSFSGSPVTIPQLALVASSPTAAVSQTYWGAATNGAGLPTTINVFGTGASSTTSTPNAQHGLFLQWTRALSLREFNDLYADPYRLWRQPQRLSLLSQHIPSSFGYSYGTTY
jgi:hypothetical protein